MVRRTLLFTTKAAVLFPLQSGVLPVLVPHPFHPCTNTIGDDPLHSWMPSWPICAHRLQEHHRNAKLSNIPLTIHLSLHMLEFNIDEFISQTFRLSWNRG